MLQKWRFFTSFRELREEIINPTKSTLPRDEAFLFDPSRVGGLGANRIHGFHPWLLKLDPAGVLYLSHPERQRRICIDA